MATKTKIMYVCPTCGPEKSFGSWRKFRGHWTASHPGEESPERESIKQEVEVEQEEPEPGEGKIRTIETGKEYPRIGDGSLPDDPVDRLGTILDVHGVDANIRNQILRIFQMHPGYKANPVNLHYLLTANLPRKHHNSIPMMVNEYNSQDDLTPEGVPLMMGGMGNQGMGYNPYMIGMPGMGNQPYGGYPMYNIPNYSRRPTSRREETEEGDEEVGTGRGRRGRVADPMEQMANMMKNMGAFMTAMDSMRRGKGEGEGGNAFLEAFEKSQEQIAEAMEEVSDSIKSSKEETKRLLDEQEKKHREEMDTLKQQVHAKELAHLEEKIEDLKDEKEDEKTTGLGSLIHEAGESMGAQIDGVRKSMETGMGQVTRIAENLSKSVVPPGAPGAATSVEKTKTVAEASALIEAESEVDKLAKELTQGN